MATKFSPRIEQSNTKTYIKEIVSVTGSLISGSYPEPALAGTNIKNDTAGMFQQVFDFPHLSQSAESIFDITFGVRNGGQFSSAMVVGTDTDSLAKINVYNQMCAIMLGYDQTGSLRNFDVSGAFDGVNSTSVMDAPVFIDFSRAVGKDELEKGSFELKFATGSYDNDASVALRTITDSGSSDLENGLRILKETTNNSNVGILDRYRGIAAIQLSSSVVTTLLSTDEDGGMPNLYNIFVSSSNSVNYGFSGSIHSGTIADLATAFRHRVFNMQVTNNTQLNTVIYQVNAGASEFNYSSNPSYIDGESVIRVKKSEAGALQPQSIPYAYITGIGLYSPDDELLAVAKLSTPVKKDTSKPFLLNVKLTY